MQDGLGAKGFRVWRRGRNHLSTPVRVQPDSFLASNVWGFWFPKLGPKPEARTLRSPFKIWSTESICWSFAPRGLAPQTWEPVQKDAFSIEAELKW